MFKKKGKSEVLISAAQCLSELREPCSLVARLTVLGTWRSHGERQPRPLGVPGGVRSALRGLVGVSVQEPLLCPGPDPGCSRLGRDPHAGCGDSGNLRSPSSPRGTGTSHGSLLRLTVQSSRSGLWTAPLQRPRSGRGRQAPEGGVHCVS